MGKAPGPCQHVLRTLTTPMGSMNSSIGEPGGWDEMRYLRPSIESESALEHDAQVTLVQLKFAQEVLFWYSRARGGEVAVGRVPCWGIW